MACWYTCVFNFFFFFLHGWENVTEVIMHSKMRTVNFVYNMRGKWKYENGSGDKAACRVEMKRRNAREGKTVVKQNRGNCRQSRYVRLLCMCGFFSHYLKKKPVKWRRRLKCLSKWKIATIPRSSYCNHFNPSAVRVPGCVDTVKRRDASRCMTN